MLFASPINDLNWQVFDSQGKNVSPFNSTGSSEYVKYDVSGIAPFEIRTDQGGGQNLRSITDLEQDDLVIAVPDNTQGYKLVKAGYFSHK